MCFPFNDWICFINDLVMFSQSFLDLIFFLCFTNYTIVIVFGMFEFFVFF